MVHGKSEKSGKARFWDEHIDNGLLCQCRFTSVFEGSRLRLPSINRFYLDCLTSGRGTVEDLSFSSHL
jgi:hypothetical protein